MIAYLEGPIAHRSAAHVYIDIGGIAYDVQISLNTYGKLETLEKVKLFTHLIVREDAQQLYGFFDEDERDLFVKLISVSGVGPNTARVILSYMTPSETRSAILTDNVPAFKKVKGVGPKTAKRIILDLRDKITLDPGVELQPVNISESPIRQEALSALVALGFQKSQVNKALDKVLSRETGIDQVETLIKSVLRQLS